LPACHPIAGVQAEHICLFERLFPAIGNTASRSDRHNLRMCAAKAVMFDDGCLKRAVIAHRMREFA
jgi:hypothetical protein